MMSKEAMRLALHKAFQLGQRYWSWADSEYSSHWKKADAAKAEFDQLVQDTINAARAEQPAQQEPGRNHWEDGDVFERIAEMKKQPAQQEPAAYGMFDTMLGKGNRMMMVRLDKGQDGCTVPLYTSPPAQRKPLTDEQMREVLRTCQSDAVELLRSRWLYVKEFARAIEAAHGIKENT